jgi:hypothetical protein
MLVRLTAKVDTKCRIRVAQRFMAENPQLLDESRHDYMRRVHWAVLTTLGLPPFQIVKFWLRHNDYYILAPIDLILKYAIETQGKPLPNGELDPQIRNGQARMIVDLLQSLEDSKRQSDSGSHDNPTEPVPKPPMNETQPEHLTVHPKTNTLIPLEPGQIPGGFWRVMAEPRVSSEEPHKPSFGVPYLTPLEQYIALWSNLFELGGMLGAKHAAKLDAFVSGFLGLTGEAGEAERVFIARANYLVSRHSLNSMKSHDLILADLADRRGYKGDIRSRLLMDPAMQKISPDVAARDGWIYARDGAALGSIFPGVVRAIFERSYAAISKQEWDEACASGLVFGPEPPPQRSYEETMEQDNKKFMEYCRQFRADVYAVLKD